MRKFEVFFQARLVEVGLVATREGKGVSIGGLDLLLEDAGVLRALDLNGVCRLIKNEDFGWER